MRLEKDEWPVSKNVGKTVVPEEELLKPVIAFAVMKIDSFNLERFRSNSYIFLFWHV